MQENSKYGSTVELLICGFIRYQISTENIIPMDITSVCQQFMSDISSFAIHRLSLFSHDDQTLHPCDSISNIVASEITDSELTDKCHSDITFKLVGPNKILLTKYKVNGRITYLSYYCLKKATIGYKVFQTSDNVNSSNDCPTDPMCALSNSDVDTFGSVKCIDNKRCRVLTFGGIKRIGAQIVNWMTHSTKFSAIKTIRSCAYTTNDHNSSNVGELINGRGYMSLCNINDEQIAVIGGRQNIDQYIMRPFVIVDCVELFSLQNNTCTAIKHLNYPRLECGSYYNPYSNEIIVFGGHDRFDSENSHKNDTIYHSMEIYDFHKNVWIDLPDRTNKKYYQYPCIWTVGGKCIFVGA
eukprot:268693_1